MWHILNEVYLKYTVYTVYVCMHVYICACTIQNFGVKFLMDVFSFEKSLGKLKERAEI